MIRVAIIVIAALVASCALPHRIESEPADPSKVDAPLREVPPIVIKHAEPTPRSSVRTFSGASTNLYARVVDVGAGLCVIIRTPDGYSMVYDAGHWEHDLCASAVSEVLGDDAAIDLMVLSHGDSDHIGNVAQILSEHPVEVLFWTGDRRTSNTWRAASSAIANAARSGTDVYSLQSYQLQPGAEIQLGGTTVTLVAGWGRSPWSGLDSSDRNNVISIVARVQHGSNSLLLTGDTIGRDRDQDNSVEECASAEAYMVQNQAAVPLRSTIMTAPHHGGNNGSSSCFIEAVSPEWVIFSSGHDHGHPRQLAADRYLARGVAANKMLRTDRGDDEGDKEWDAGAILGCSDRPGDDDVVVLMPKTRRPTVKFLNADSGC